MPQRFRRLINFTSSNASRHIFWLILFGITITAGVLGFYFLAPILVPHLGLSPLSPEGYLAATSIFASTILTFSLISVYAIMARSQTNQTKIQRNQEELMENSHRSLLQIEDYLFLSADEISLYSKYLGYPLPEWEFHGAKCSLRLSNYGSGPAYGLKIAVIIESEKSLEDDNGTVTKVRIDGTSAPLFKGNNWDPVASSKPDNWGIIGAEQDFIDYLSTITFSADEDEINVIGEEGLISPTEMLWWLQDEGFTRAKIGLRLYYKDGTGPREPINIRFVDVELGKHINFAWALYLGDPIDYDEIPVVEGWGGGGIYD